MNKDILGWGFKKYTKQMFKKKQHWEVDAFDFYSCVVGGGNAALSVGCRRRRGRKGRSVGRFSVAVSNNVHNPATKELTFEGRQKRHS